jgi:hypothetical protein
MRLKVNCNTAMHMAVMGTIINIDTKKVKTYFFRGEALEILSGKP